VVLAACSGPPKRSSQPPPHATLAFTRAHVFDGERLLPGEVTVLVDGDSIVAIGADAGVPPGAQVIDAQGHTLLPGLIDAHVHVFERAALAQSLAFGVTTVLDMFAAPVGYKQLRGDAALDHADIRSAVVLATVPGGHGTEYGFEIPTLTRPEEAQAWVDARIAEGSDYIKIVFDDGSAYKKQIPTLDTPTFAALVAAAHARHKLAVVHIGDYAHARTAIENGADGLVHLFRDRAPEADFGAMVAAHKAFVVPTLVVSQGLYGTKSTIAGDPAIPPYLSAAARDNLAAAFGFRAVGEPEAANKAVAQLRDAGVTLLCGTDSPNPGTTYGASMHEELSLLVAAGLTPSAALTAATAAAADRFSLNDRGRIAVGKHADLLLVKGDPTVDITSTRQIAGIWRSGKQFDRAAYQAHVEADNRAAVAAAAAAASPSDLGIISDFDSGLGVKVGTAWTASTDSLVGGTSKATLTSVGGAHGSKGALEISGELVLGGAANWAGAMWMPGLRPFSPLNVSAKKGFSFLARGDGKAYTVMVFSQKGGRMPSAQPFTPGADFAPVAFTWSQFGSDGSDITALIIGQTTAGGAFKLTVDDVQLQ
jgi:imidazolonepropionase-like amidohydrolase